MKLTGSLLRVAEVTVAQRAQMFALMDRHYENMQRDCFEADLDEKHWVIVVRDVCDQVCGFSTQMLLEVEAQGRPIKALFSGDTIIERRHWGDRALSHVWGRLALSLIDLYPADELCWFLISKGYKTYRFLPLFFREFYPRSEGATPVWATEMLDALGRHKFPEAYDPRRGIVRAWPGKDRLRDDIAPVTPERLRDPHVRYFVERNPGHARGEELCCIAPLMRGNFTPAAYRMIGSEAALLKFVG